ncbi:MAG: alpha/beta fold hydrolase [Betaproteobacteria bacterium]|nr:alpha/beta fold hydrolase [Betaproteobacteria bacterium]
MPSELDLPINPSAYEWSGRFMRFLRRVLKVNIRLHHDEGQIDSGDIFVFNHFARFETFIPQYLFWEHSGAYCRSIADRGLFARRDRFSQYLQAVGAVPNDHPHLLTFLAAEVLRGRKIIVFPEGGMVKDRQVVDVDGEYSIYSRTAQERRKQHSGAAVIAMALEVFKKAVVLAAERDDRARLDSWCSLLGAESHDSLLAKARRPTRIVPANITFHPMRVQANALQRGVELFNRGISPRMREELLIEGNILLRDTDMDIRLGDPLRATSFWTQREHRMVAERAARLGMLEDAFTAHGDRADRRMHANATRLQPEKLRDAYMHEMYQLLTVNLGHLAALLVYRHLDGGETSVPELAFHRTLYLAIKYLQREDGVHLHRSLRNPDRYAGLPDGACVTLQEFMATADRLGLIRREDGNYRFLPKLRQDHHFDEVRLENPIEVSANEVAPIRAARDCVDRAMRDAAALSAPDLAGLLFDDERRSHDWDRNSFSKPRHAAINALQTHREDAAPFLHHADAPRRMGVLLVHGFLASPAEVREFGRHLAQHGFVNMGVRLKGHGTSPWDLNERTRHEWIASVRRGYELLAPLVDEVCVVGFSTGGLLGLELASTLPARLAGVAAISAPVRFRNRNMAFVPLVHGTNKLANMVGRKGVVTFRPNASEHPHINYVHLPIRALYELGRLVDQVRRRLALVQCPALILQGDRDPVVDPLSAMLLFRDLGTGDKRVRMLPSARHGILYENVGGTWTETLAFLQHCEARPAMPEVPDGISAMPVEAVA